MYNKVTEQFVNTIRSPSRTFNGRVKINGKWIDARFKKMSYETSSSSEESLQLGSAVSAKIELTIEKVNELFENTEIAVEIGLKLSDKIEYIPVGFFTAEHPTSDKDNTTFTAYDRMMKTTGVYISNLSYPADAESLLKEISTACKIPCDVSGVSSIVIESKPVGYTYREVIGYIAALAGGFACIDRSGTLVIKSYVDSGFKLDESRIFSFEKNESDYHLDYLSCNISNSSKITSGSGTLGITFDNPLMTQERLNSIYESMKNFSYRGGTVKALGDIRLDPWDIITVIQDGIEYKMPVMNIQQEYDGGLAMSITSYGKTEVETSTDFKGPTSKSVERMYSDIVLAQELLAQKVDADWVKANTVTAEKLDVVTAEIKNIENDYLKTKDADIKYATIESEKVITSEIENLKVGVEKVGILDGDVAKIKTLMFGSAAGGSLTTEFSNLVVSMIGDAQIKSAMIDSLEFNKLTGIDINTTKLNVHSDDGKSTWKDNTIQISDAKRVRVQIGKDAMGDYNIYIWDKNGKLMFDPLYGIQADGIKQAIIRNDMVADNAAIKASKLDIESVFSVINSDKSHTLNASKIYVDTDKQTLDVAFKSMSTTVTETVTIVNTAVSTANTASSTASTANSNASSALNKANSAVSTANTANSTANTAKTTADTAKSTANTASTNASNALSKANTLETNLKTVTEKVSSQGTTLSTIQGQISTKVWKQDITTAVSELQIGGRNLVKNSNFSNNANNWSNWGSPATREIVTIDGKRWAHVKGTGDARYQGYYQDWNVTVPIEKTLDTEYTFSARVKGASANQEFWVIFHWRDAKGNFVSSSGSSFMVSENEQIVTSTVKTNNRENKSLTEVGRFTICLGVNNASTVYEVYFTDVKFEKGNKVTDWSPAIEDTDSSISALEGKTTTLTNQYTSLNQTLTSLTATVNSNTTAISKKADGTTVSTLQTNVTQLTADLSGFKTTVSSTYATKSSLSGYATTSAVNTAINQKADSITQSVSATYATKNSLNEATKSINAKLELKVDTEKLISCINAAADEIKLTSNRFSLSSTYTTITSAGQITTQNVTVSRTQNAYVNPGQIECSTLRSFLYGTTPSTEQKNLYDFKKDGKLDVFDLIAARQMTLGYKNYDGKQVPVEVILDSNNPESFIKITCTNAWGRQLTQRFGANGVNVTSTITTDLVAQNANITYIRSNPRFCNYEDNNAGKFNVGNAIISSEGGQDLKLYASDEDNNLRFGVLYDGNGKVVEGWAFNPWGGAPINLGSGLHKWECVYAAVGAINTSDRNEKNSIENLDEESCIEFLKTWKPVSYKMNNGTSDRKHYGFIAQDIEESMKKLGIASKDFAGFIKSQKSDEHVDEYGRTVAEERIGEYEYGLRYSEFIAPVVKTVQYCLRIIEQHESDIEKLKQLEQ